jgi:hypothetical protein
MEKDLFLRFPLLLVVFEAMPVVRWLVGDFSPQRPEFDFRLIHAGFVMDKAAETDISSSTSVFPVHVIPRKLHIN